MSTPKIAEYFFISALDESKSLSDSRVTQTSQFFSAEAPVTPIGPNQDAALNASTFLQSPALTALGIEEEFWQNFPTLNGELKLPSYDLQERSAAKDSEKVHYYLLLISGLILE
jgi:hypothetical protein